MSDMNQLTETIKSIRPLDPAWFERAEDRQLQLTKPPGSLGRVERVANRLCAIQRSLRPTASPRRVVVIAADHGVTEEGVSAYPPDVTSQMLANFRAGGAAINAFSRAAGADLLVVDIGTAGDEQRDINPDPGAEGQHVRFIRRRVRRGAGNIARGPAMTEAEMLAALGVGIDLADDASREGFALLGLGEMGIGNTTSASAITAALTGLPPETVTGRGTGADEVTFQRKIKAVERALAVNVPLRADVLDVLLKVGGLEIAGLCGVCLGAAAARIGIVADGFIATAGAALAVRLCPAVADYVFAGHLSPEPGHRFLLDLIGRRPLLSLEMRLGEGTGAALAMGIIDAAAMAFREMATFASAGVRDKQTPAGCSADG